MTETINDRIEILVNERFGGNKAAFAKSIGLLPTGLSNYLGKQRRSKPSVDMINKIVTTHNVDARWLLTGETAPSGEKNSGGEKNFTPETDSDDAPVPVISYTEGVPYYDEDFLLGFDEITAPNSENPEYLISMPGYEKATLWCNASGHSMEPEINHGDILALQRVPDFSFLPFGDIYGFITTNGMRTIKRLGRSTREGFYRLIPTNKDYDEQEIPISAIAIVYRVLGAMKGF